MRDVGTCQICRQTLTLVAGRGNVIRTHGYVRGDNKAVEQSCPGSGQAPAQADIGFGESSLRSLSTRLETLRDDHAKVAAGTKLAGPANSVDALRAHLQGPGAGRSAALTPEAQDYLRRLEGQIGELEQQIALINSALLYFRRPVTLTRVRTVTHPLGTIFTDRKFRVWEVIEIAEPLPPIGRHLARAPTYLCQAPDRTGRIRKFTQSHVSRGLKREAPPDRSPAPAAVAPPALKLTKPALPVPNF